MVATGRHGISRSRSSLKARPNDRGKREILLAVDDASAMFVADHSDALRDEFRFPHQPDGLVRALADKRRMHRLCLEHAIPAPQAALPQSREEVLEHAAPVLRKALADSPSAETRRRIEHLLDKAP